VRLVRVTLLSARALRLEGGLWGQPAAQASHGWSHGHYIMTWISTSPGIYLFVCLFVCLSVCLPVCLSVYLISFDLI